MKIQPNETVLTGSWVMCAGQVVGDDTSERIDKLIRGHLRLLGRHANGWEALYRDPDDGRLWELTYPHGEMQGGGPQQLRCMTSEDAKKKYGGISDA